MDYIRESEVLFLNWREESQTLKGIRSQEQEQYSSRVENLKSQIQELQDQCSQDQEEHSLRVEELKSQIQELQNLRSQDQEEHSLRVENKIQEDRPLPEMGSSNPGLFIKYNEEQKITADLKVEVNRVKELMQALKWKAGEMEEKLVKKKAAYKRKLSEEIEKVEGKKEKKRARYEEQIAARVLAEANLRLLEKGHRTQLKDLEVAHKRRTDRMVNEISRLEEKIDRITHISASRRAATGNHLRTSKAKNRALTRKIAQTGELLSYTNGKPVWGTPPRPEKGGNPPTGRPQSPLAFQG